MTQYGGRYLGAVVRRFWGIVFGGIIALAVIIQIGRQAFQVIGDYREPIATAIGAQLGVRVEVDDLEARWQGMRPRIHFKKLRVSTLEGQLLFSVESAVAEMGLLDSMIQRSLAWREIHFEQLNTTFVQRKDFSWSINGADLGTSNSKNNFSFDDPFDIFLFGRRIDIRSANLAFELQNGERTRLVIPEITLENDRFFHRMLAVVEHDDRESFYAVIEGYGDPRDKGNFSASGYARLSDIPSGRMFAALVPERFQGHQRTATQDGAELLLGAADTSADGGSTLALELWFNGSASAGLTSSGRLNIQGFPSSLQTPVVLPTALAAEFSGRWHTETGWHLNFPRARFMWGDGLVSEQSLSLYGDGHTVLGARVDELDVGAWMQRINDLNQASDDPVVDVIRRLRARGKLRHVDMQLRRPEEGYFFVRAELEAAGIDAVMGIPELRHVNAYTELNLFGGYAHVYDSPGVLLGLPTSFDHGPFQFDSVEGQLAWSINLQQRIAYLKSGLIRARQGEKQARGGFALELPFVRDIGEQTLSLRMHVDRAAATDYRPFLPSHVPDSLKHWLDGAVQAGNLIDIDVLYRGSVQKDPQFPPRFELSARVHDLGLVFDPEWPAVTAARGRLTLDGESLFAQLDAAELQGNQLRDTQVVIVKPESPTEARRVQLHGYVEGDARDARELLLNSALAKSLDSFLPSWDLTGSYLSELQLSVPVEKKAGDLAYRVDTQLSSVTLRMNDLDLEFRKLRGHFSYDNVNLLQAESLEASLWDETLRATIRSQTSPAQLEAEFALPVEANALQNWLNRPELVFLHGRMEVLGRLQVPFSGGGMQLQLDTNLRGAGLQLPFPLAKEYEDEGLYQVGIAQHDDGLRYNINLNNRLFIELREQPDAIPALRASLDGGDLQSLPLVPGQLVFKGRLEHAQFESWKAALDRYLEAGEADAAESGDASAAPLLVKGELDIAAFELSELDFGQLHLNLRNDLANWYFDFAGEALNGEVRLPTDSAPPVMHLRHLSVFYDELEVDAEHAVEEFALPEDLTKSAFADLDPAALPSAEVTIDRLFIRNRDWGQWQFSLRPSKDALALHALRANFLELRIGEEEPADLLFSTAANQRYTKFTGRVRVNDVGNALEAWDQERLLSSQAATFDIDLSWPGAPDEVELTSISGEVELDMRSGSFIRGAEAGENPLLRLIALFNFDTIARRIRLDFSDLAAKGFSYDTVQSRVKFDAGAAQIVEPLVVKASSSKMQVAGTIDLLRETLDTELVVTLPVAGNLAVAAAFIAGLPTGLGIYLVSKMFNEQVDKVSSISYTVEGPWSDPSLTVTRIFDDNAAREKGKTLEQPKVEK